MSKRRRRREAAKKQNKTVSERGFDFGFIPKIMYVNSSSLDFNRHAIAANIFGCAYGYDKVNGYPAPIPCMTLIGENSDELRAAANCLKQWGCNVDGDAVDINLVLKNDGGYFLGLQPDQARLANRHTKDDALADVLYTGATWIKRMDSTNPILFEWKEYLRSRLSPIKIMFGTANSVNGIPQISSVRSLPDAVSFIKFRLKIETEKENPSHWFFSAVGEDKKFTRNERELEEPIIVSSARKRVIDSAFPLSRERIRRLNIHKRFKELTNFESISHHQIEQATLNILLSREWLDGADHYVGMDNLYKEWWDRISRRVEICGYQNHVGDIPLQTIAHQLTLDVADVLQRHGATVSPKFQSNQRLFLRLGYGIA